ncbi:MAG: hypothetical protein ABI904_04180 [Chloroflexota bacterium]
MQKKTATLLFLLVFLVACASPAPQPTATSIPSPTLTATPSPTETPEPTLTPTASDPEAWHIENGIAYQSKDVTPIEGQEFQLKNTAEIYQTGLQTIWAATLAKALVDLDMQKTPVPEYLKTFEQFQAWVNANGGKVSGLAELSKTDIPGSMYASTGKVSTDPGEWDLSQIHIVFGKLPKTNDSRGSGVGNGTNMGVYWLQVVLGSDGLPEIRIGPRFIPHNKYKVLAPSPDGSSVDNAQAYSVMMAAWQEAMQKRANVPFDQWDPASGWGAVNTKLSGNKAGIDLNWNGVYDDAYIALTPNNLTSFVVPK